MSSWDGLAAQRAQMPTQMHFRMREPLSWLTHRGWGGRISCMLLIFYVSSRKFQKRWLKLHFDFGLQVMTLRSARPETPLALLCGLARPCYIPSQTADMVISTRANFGQIPRQVQVCGNSSLGCCVLLCQETGPKLVLTSDANRNEDAIGADYHSQKNGSIGPKIRQKTC